MLERDQPTADTTHPRRGDRALLWIGVVGLLIVLAVWVALTPGGLLGKADAVGYAVCHRIAVRSFAFPDGRALPLCARCSGTFLGVLIGLFGPGLVLGRRRMAAFPPLPILAVMLGMSALWAFDGANSFAHLITIPGVPLLYEPSNFLRLLTGTFHGITMGGLILPIVNSALWADASPAPTLERWWHLPALYAIGALTMALVLSGQGVFLYPLALLSAAGVVVNLAAIVLVFVVTVLHRENRARTLGDALPVLAISLALTFLAIGGIDAARYAAFGTWDGFIF